MMLLLSLTRTTPGSNHVVPGKPLEPLEERTKMRHEGLDILTGLEGLEGKELLWPERFSGSCASDILAIVCKLAFNVQIPYGRVGPVRQWEGNLQVVIVHLRQSNSVVLGHLTKTSPWWK